MTTGDGGMQPSALELAPGQVLAGRYRVDRILGQGGMGMVVSAVHIQLKTPVAIKILKRDAAMFPDAAARFLREARAAANLNNEHVARVTDFGTLDDGAPFLVMEYLEGKDLAALLEVNGALPVDQAVDYLLQACEALAKAHVLGIVHRDIKPANLFVTRGDDGLPCVKVLDFGISKVAQDNAWGPETHPVETGIAWGSPHYMSPEQIRGSLDMDGRTDIWALGVTLFQLLTNALPFMGTGVHQITALILERVVPSVRDFRPELPAGLDEAIQRCLAKDRAHRWRNVAQLAQALVPFGSKRALISFEKILAIMPDAIARAAPKSSSTMVMPTLPMNRSMGQHAVAPAMTASGTPLLQPSVEARVNALPQLRTRWPLFMTFGALGVTSVVALLGIGSCVRSRGKTTAVTSAVHVTSNWLVPSSITPAPSAAVGLVPANPVLRLDVPETLLVNRSIRISITATARMYIALLAVDASGSGSLLLPNQRNALPVASPDAVLHFPSPDEERAGLTPMASLPAGKTSTNEKFVCLGFADEPSYKRWVEGVRRGGAILSDRRVIEFVEGARRDGAVVFERGYEIVR